MHGAPPTPTLGGGTPRLRRLCLGPALNPALYTSAVTKVFVGRQLSSHLATKDTTDIVNSTASD